jgi:hypothetical protein
MNPLPERPSRSVVESIIRSFFGLLAQQKLDEAEHAVDHHSLDWPFQIWPLWQDTVALDMDPDDPAWSFEAGTWKQHLSWLGRIGIDNTFHWSDDGNSLFTHVTDNGELTDTSADFDIVEKDGGWVVRRVIIHVA